jgi:D-alanyl-D-alanine-carboxypeptidase/D-alanyl-D-alanine-endopeptidase
MKFVPRIALALLVLLSPLYSLAQAPATPVSVSAETLATYVGNYTLAPGVYMMVTLENGQLITQITGQGKVPITAESETRFIPQNIAAVIEFQKDAAGAVTGLVLNQGGRSMPAPRFTGEVPAAPVHTEITLPEETLARYVGNYAFAPTFVIAITLENGQLMEQATGQPKFPIFPETETRFFLKVVEATIEFQVNAAGEVTGATLNQSGQSLAGAKQ